MAAGTLPAMSTRLFPHRLPVLLLLVATALAAVLGGRPALATEADAGPVVEVLPVRGFLDPPVVRAMENLLADAQTSGATLVVLQVDGPGGISADIDGLLAAIAESTVPVAVYVSPQQGLDAEAGGAYGMLWAAADLRAMSESSSVGPLDPPNLADDPGDPDVAGLVAGFLGDGADLVLDRAATAEELEAAGVVDVIAPNMAALLTGLDGRAVTTADGDLTLELPRDDVEVRLHSLGLLSRLLHAAAAPAFIYILLVLGLGMLAFEVFQPGFGVAGFAGLLMLPFAGFGLTVLPVAWWALALLLVGLVLYGVDAALAGLGPLTAVATAAFTAGSWFLFGTGVLRVPVAVVVLTTIVAFSFFVVVLTVILRAQAGPDGVDVGDLVGRHGIVRSILNPEGHVYIDEALWRARVDEDRRLRVGTPVTVTGVDGAVLVVEPFEAAPAGAATSPGADEAAPAPDSA